MGAVTIHLTPEQERRVDALLVEGMSSKEVTEEEFWHSVSK